MEGQVFVACERELGQLDGFLNRALAGQGQVCFVMGEAGSGKTALVTEFARCAQEQHADLIVAVGQSDAQTGIGDPYLPFREVLGQLTGDVKAKLAQGAITEENADRLRRFLRASQDPRARTVLNTAHRLLGERAAKISDEELRRSFLDNVAVHREIVSEFTNAG